MAAEIRQQARRVLAWSIVAAVTAGIVCPFVGGMGLDYGKLWRRESPDWHVFIALRLPRTALALLAGAALSSAGALFQALLRNALATPSSLGVETAAALGAVTVIALFAGDDTRFPLVWLAAMAGAAAVIVTVALVGRAQKFTSFTLLLAGVAVNSICTAMVLLLHSMAGITKSFQITHWLMGGIDAVEYQALLLLTAVIVPVCAWMLRQARVLNVISYGETWAIGRGVDFESLTWRGFTAGALLVGTVTAITGPIAFVGLIVPHLLRKVVGPDYRMLLPASIFGGAAFMVLCDTIARSVLAPVEIPVGVITALLGGPFFVWLLWSR